MDPYKLIAFFKEKTFISLTVFIFGIVACHSFFPGISFDIWKENMKKFLEFFQISTICDDWYYIYPQIQSFSRFQFIIKQLQITHFLHKWKVFEHNMIGSIVIAPKNKKTKCCEELCVTKTKLISIVQLNGGLQKYVNIITGKII